MQTVITLLEADTPDLLDRCLAVRQEVFTREMGVPADVERDSRDCLDGECRHFLITRDGRDIGAVRCLPQEDGTLRLTCKTVTGETSFLRFDPEAWELTSDPGVLPGQTSDHDTAEDLWGAGGALRVFLFCEEK